MQLEIEAQQRHFVQLHQAMEVLREEHQVCLPCLLWPPVLGQCVRTAPNVSACQHIQSVAAHAGSLSASKQQKVTLDGCQQAA